MAYPNNPDSPQGPQNTRKSPFGVNKLVLVGSIAYGPEDKYQGSVVQFGLTTGNVSNTRNPSGAPEEFRETYDVVVYGNTARYILDNRLPKGTWMYVEGRLRKRKWYDSNSGSPRYGYDVVAQRVIILNKMVHAWEKQRMQQNMDAPPPPPYEPTSTPESGVSGVNAPMDNAFSDPYGAVPYGPSPEGDDFPPF